MRAYQHAYKREDGARRLSQNGLLDLMAEVDSRYAGQYDHSAVVRWESGAIRPTRERLEVFGRALGLSRGEVDGLISLAGLDASTSKAAGTPVVAGPAAVGSAPSAIASRGRSTADRASGHDAEEATPFVRNAARQTASRFLLPAALVSIAGYFLALLGWNSSFSLAMYVGGALCALTAHGFIRLHRSDDLGDLLFVSVFFLLSIPLLHAPLTRMDAYGLYSIGNLAGTSMPFTLSLIVNLLVAEVSALLFAFFSDWQRSGPEAERSVYARAAWTVLPPTAFVYAFLLAFSNVGFWIVGMGLFTLLAGGLTALLVLRDSDLTVSEWDRKFLLSTVAAAIIVLSALGMGAILATYLQPSAYDVSEQGLFFSWATDFEALGYPAEEYFERSRLGVTWASMTTVFYMVIVIGGRLIFTIYRLDDGDSPKHQAAAEVVSDEPPRSKRKSRRSWVDFRYQPGWISGFKLIRPNRSRYLAALASSWPWKSAK